MTPQSNQEEASKQGEDQSEKIMNVAVDLGPRLIMVGDEALGTADNIAIVVAEATRGELEKLKGAYELRLIKMIH